MSELFQVDDLLKALKDPSVSVSPLALATSLANPQVEIIPPEKVEVMDANFVSLSIAYNAFDMKELDHHELEWRKGARLKDYLKGLPADAEWAVFINGEEVDLKKDANRKLNKLDHIGLILVPQGGGSMKKIIMAVVAVAMVVVGALTGQTWLVVAGIAMAVSMVSMMLMMPKKPKNNGQDDSSYGIDGAKNTATENIVYPIVYGEFRTAGNFCDAYTENVGDDQYLYLRAVLNDGEIEGAYDIELNEQPISNFHLVETRLFKGTLDQSVNDWFPASIVQFNKAAKLTEEWITHTSGEVDRVRFDITFPGGLTNIKKSDGSYGMRSVDFEVQYCPKASSAWQPLPLTTWSKAPPTASYTASTGTELQVSATYTGVESLQFSAEVPSYLANQYPAEIRLANLTDGTEVPVGQMYATDEQIAGYVFDQDAADGSVVGSDITPMITQSFTVDGLDPTKEYQLRAVRGAGTLSSDLKDLAMPVLFSEVNLQYAASGKFTITDHRTRAIRRSVASVTLPRGEYNFRIRRVTPIVPEHDDWIDECHLTDIAEIDNTPVTLSGTANLSLKIKLNDQLNGIPQFTARVKGSLCNIYDIEGNVIDRRWTDNPAWQGLDVYLGEERGAGIKKSRIDWPRYIEFAEWCETQNLKFNGVFSSPSNMAEAHQQILRIGHAAPVPFGTKMSVAIDRPRDPVHVFTQANIVKDSFQITYMAMGDRANEYEFSYFDKTDRNKQKTIRYVDPKAIQFGDTPRPAQISFPGVDNFEQARKELWKAIYANRLIIRTVQLEAWIDAINMTLGENALVQHDMMEWGNGGRLKDGCTASTLILDQKVEMTQASNVIVLFDAIQRTASTVAQVTGKRVFITRPGGNALTTLELASKRLIAGGKDYEIAKIENGATYHIVTLADDPQGLSAGVAAELWDTDVVEERSVESVTDNGDGTSTLHLATALPMAPAPLANFAFGPVITVRKPYTLTGISGNGLEKRTLTLVEYNEGVFGAPEIEIPVPVGQVSDRLVSQVGGLMMEYDSVVDPVRNTVNVRVYWQAGHILNYGGADVYMGINGQTPTPLGSAVNVNELHTTLNIGDTVTFKVVAYNTRGDRAPFYSAPMIGGTIDPTLLGLPTPTGFTATQTAFDAAGSVSFSWTPPLDTTAIIGYEIQYKNEASTDLIGMAPVATGPVEISGQALGDYYARIRSVGTNGGYSDWVELTYSVVHPDINAAPVGLQLNGSTPADEPYGEFTGRDAVFTWTDAVRDQIYFLDYEVTIFDEQMAPLRVEYRTTPDYTYSFDKNTIDGAGTPRRAFNISIRQRGRQGQLSPARTMFAQNPAPAFATAPLVEGVVGGISVKCVMPQDPDLVGIRVYGSLTDPVEITGANLIYQGASSSQVIQPIEAAAQHYVRVVPYDAFGNGTPSGQFIVLPASIEDLFDNVAPDQTTGLELSSSLQVNLDNTITPTLTASWNASIAPDINRYEVEIKQQDGNYVGFQSGRNSFEWRGVLSGEQYTVRVRGVDHMGNKGAWSTEVSHVVATDSIPPAVPGSFVASAAFSTAFLEWLSPDDSDLKSIIVYENTTNSPTTATAIATVSALPGQRGTYTRSGLAVNQTRYYWLSAVDTSGNESAKTVMKNITTAGIDTSVLLGQITETQIADDSISTPKIQSLSIVTGHITAGAIVSEHITVGTLLGDRILAGSLEGSALSITTALPATISVGATGVTIGTVQSQAAVGAQDPATRVNAGTTLISPGKISISGATTLTSILYGGDNTKIDGGAIAANTITANKVSIGVRGITVDSIEFEHNKPAANRVSWTAGTITYVDNAGALQSVAITAGSSGVWASGILYIYWVIGENILRVATAASTANGADRLVVATYGGGTNLVANFGRTIIDGSKIVTGSIQAQQLAVSSLSAVSANIGLLRTATSGARTEIEDNQIRVYDSNGTLRVRMGVW